MTCKFCSSIQHTHAVSSKSASMLVTTNCHKLAHRQRTLQRRRQLSQPPGTLSETTRSRTLKSNTTCCTGSGDQTPHTYGNNGTSHAHARAHTRTHTHTHIKHKDLRVSGTERKDAHIHDIHSMCTCMIAVCKAMRHKRTRPRIGEEGEQLSVSLQLQTRRLKKSPENGWPARARCFVW